MKKCEMINNALKNIIDFTYEEDTKDAEYHATREFCHLFKYFKCGNAFKEHSCDNINEEGKEYIPQGLTSQDVKDLRRALHKLDRITTNWR